MTRDEFIKKWSDPKYGPYWNQDIDSLFWAASYRMETSKLIELSTDYLKLPEKFRSWTSSSFQLADQTLKKHNAKYLTYGIAGLFQ